MTHSSTCASNIKISNRSGIGKFYQNCDCGVCCEKCLREKDSDYWFDANSPVYDCINSTCPCHTPKSALSKCCGAIAVQGNIKGFHTIGIICSACSKPFTPAEDQKEERVYGKSMYEIEMEYEKLKQKEEGRCCCAKCDLETQPNMICKCPERQNGNWVEKESWEDGIKEVLGAYVRLAPETTKAVISHISSLLKEREEKARAAGQKIIEVQELERIQDNAWNSALEAASEVINELEPSCACDNKDHFLKSNDVNINRQSAQSLLLSLKKKV